MGGHDGPNTNLADQLHVTILDTIVHHLDIVSRSRISHPLAARFAIALGSDALKDILDVWPGFLISTGHQRRAIAGALLSSRDAGSDKADALGLEVVGPAVGIWIVRVAAINDDVSRLNMGQEGLDEVVDGLAGHDEHHHTTGLLELGDKVLDGVGALDRFA